MDFITPYDRALILSYLRDPADVACARGVCRDWRELVAADPRIPKIIKQAANNILIYGCKIDCIPLVKYAIRRGAINQCAGLTFAFKNNNVKLVKLLYDGNIYNDGCPRFISKAFQYNNRELIEIAYKMSSNNHAPAYGAYRGGHLDLIAEIAARGPTDWPNVLNGACRGGHIELVKSLLDEHTFNNLNDALTHACRGGHLDVVRMLAARGASVRSGEFRESCKCGSVEVAKYLISLNASGISEKSTNIEIIKLLLAYDPEKCKTIFLNACFNDNVEVARLLIDKVNKEDDAYNFDAACAYGSFGLVKIIYDKKISVGHKININNCFCSPNNDIVNFAISRGASNWNLGLKYACFYGNLEGAEMMISRGATNVDEGLINACYNGHRDVVDLMLAHGATVANKFINSVRSDYPKLAAYLILLGARVEYY